MKDSEKRNQRAGDVLGLGDAGSSIADRDASIVDTSTEDAPKRRRRMSDGADELTPGATPMDRSSGGATSVDMGAGGDGTDIE